MKKSWMVLVATFAAVLPFTASAFTIDLQNVSPTSSVGHPTQISISYTGLPDGIALCGIGFADTVLLVRDGNADQVIASLPTPLIGSGLATGSYVPSQTGNQLLTFFEAKRCNETISNLSQAKATALVYVTASVVPNLPTLTGHSLGEVNVPVDFAVSAHDDNGDQVRVGMDWNRDGMVDEWVPSAGYMNSDDVQHFTHTWSALGAHNFQLRSEDVSGKFSDWKQYKMTTLFAGSSAIRAWASVGTINSYETFTIHFDAINVSAAQCTWSRLDDNTTWTFKDASLPGVLPLEITNIGWRGEHDYHWYLTCHNGNTTLTADVSVHINMPPAPLVQVLPVSGITFAQTEIRTESLPRKFIVSNVSADPLSSLSGTVSSQSGYFRCVNNCTITDLKPGVDHDVEMVFVPGNSPGTHNGTATFNTNGGTVERTMQGEGVDPSVVINPQSSIPVLEVLPINGIQFGSVEKGTESVIRRFVVNNVSTEPLSRLTGSVSFTDSHIECVTGCVFTNISPGINHYVELRVVAGNSTGMVTATAHFTSNGGNKDRVVDAEIIDSGTGNPGGGEPGGGNPGGGNPGGGEPGGGNPGGGNPGGGTPGGGTPGGGEPGGGNPGGGNPGGGEPGGGGNPGGGTPGGGTGGFAPHFHLIFFREI